MKKNWFQILSLALNVALLIALLVTRGELMNTQTILKSNLDGIAYRLSDVDDRITNLSAKQREQTESLSDFSLEPTGLDPESHTLQADMSITLRRWTADHGGGAGGDSERPDNGTAYVRERRRVHRSGEPAGGGYRRSVLRGEYYCRRSDQPGRGHQLQ